MLVYEWILGTDTDTLKIRVEGETLEEGITKAKEFVDEVIKEKKMYLHYRQVCAEKQTDEYIRTLLCQSITEQLQGLEEWERQLKKCSKKGVAWDLNEVNPILDTVESLF